MKLFTSMLFLLLAVSGPALTLACSCMAPEVPFYCHSDVFALVKILDQKQIEAKQMMVYRFKPVSIIRDSKQLVSSRRAKRFFTSNLSSLCGVELKVGSQYLIGTNVNANNRLTLGLCRSHVELYPWSGQTLESQLQELMLACEPRHETEFANSVPLTQHTVKPNHINTDTFDLP